MRHIAAHTTNQQKMYARKVGVCGWEEQQLGRGT